MTKYDTFLFDADGVFVTNLPNVEAHCIGCALEIARPELGPEPGDIIKIVPTNRDKGDADMIS